VEDGINAERVDNSKASLSYIKSLQSVCRVHNETVNIWSHIVGALVFLLVTIWWYLAEKGGDADSLAVLVYFASCVACFGCSFV
jgi:adiponectin receptor